MSLLDQLVGNSAANNNITALYRQYQPQNNFQKAQQQSQKIPNRSKSISIFSLAEKAKKPQRLDHSESKIINNIKHSSQIISHNEPTNNNQKMLKCFKKLQSRFLTKYRKRYYEFWVLFERVERMQHSRRQNIVKGFQNLIDIVDSWQSRYYSQIDLRPNFQKIKQASQNNSDLISFVEKLKKIENRKYQQFFNSLRKIQEFALKLNILQATLKISIRRKQVQAFQLLKIKMKKSQTQISFNHIKIKLNNNLLITNFQQKSNIRHNFINEHQIVSTPSIPYKLDCIPIQPQPQTYDNSILFINFPAINKKMTKGQQPTQQVKKNQKTLKKQHVQQTPEPRRKNSLFNSKNNIDTNSSKKTIKQNLNIWKQDKEILCQILENISNHKKQTNKYSNSNNKSISKFQINKNTGQIKQNEKQVSLASNNTPYQQSKKRIYFKRASQNCIQSEKPIIEIQINKRSVQKQKDRKIISLKNKRKIQRTINYQRNTFDVSNYATHQYPTNNHQIQRRHSVQENR